ncbi:alpha/beta hydrolase family protein [Tundrisphaera lichenicola]|uniref:alpha/beta hydrolase family protein n=1 Tax=Tundrisphaera lichenicola TaxID=2029860 RepID=UPI003EB948B3
MTSTLRRFLPIGLVLASLSGMASDQRVIADEIPPREAYLRFIRGQANTLRGDDLVPATREIWASERLKVRQGLEMAWGKFPTEPCSLEPRVLGTLDGTGYRVERLIFQTRPGIWMTANAYIPDGEGKHPAILSVHGHWKGAKQDPVVQSRCIGAARLGFFVLVVDAFGSGERAVGEALGEYHGEMTAATLLPVGLPLSGLQVYENSRAIDYLRTRPEVDPDRIGITGASGGGNQSMYAGAWDERLKTVVPVCSVGNYRAYLGTGCCMCEVVPGALRFTEEWGVLGLVAPRGLLLINATRDAHQFSVGEAKKSLAMVEPVFALLGHPDMVRQTVFESGHDYSRPMREAVYGWMTRVLKGEGDGSPIGEPEIKTEDPEALRCYPGQTRPDDWVTIPRFAAAEGRKLLEGRTIPEDPREWRAMSDALRSSLVEKVFGGLPANSSEAPISEPSGDKGRLIRFQPEPGLTLTAQIEAGTGATSPLAILIDLEGAERAVSSPLAEEIRKVGWGLATIDLRATGQLAWPSDKVGSAPDHNSAEWGLWIGRPLLGQWVVDVRRLLDAVEKLDGRLLSEVILVGVGPGGLVALGAGATDPRIARIAAVGSLASYLSEVPYVGQRLGIMAPGMIREIGDVAHLAALAAPRRVVIAGGVGGDGQSLSAEALRTSYRTALKAWQTAGASPEFRLLDTTDAEGLIRNLQ